MFLSCEINTESSYYEIGINIIAIVFLVYHYRVPSISICQVGHCCHLLFADGTREVCELNIWVVHHDILIARRVSRISIVLAEIGIATNGLVRLIPLDDPLATISIKEDPPGFDDVFQSQVFVGSCFIVGCLLLLLKVTLWKQILLFLVVILVFLVVLRVN